MQVLFREDRQITLSASAAPSDNNYGPVHAIEHENLELRSGQDLDISRKGSSPKGNEETSGTKKKTNKQKQRPPRGLCEEVILSLSFFADS